MLRDSDKLNLPMHFSETFVYVDKNVYLCYFVLLDGENAGLQTPVRNKKGILLFKLNCKITVEIINQLTQQTKILTN